MSGRAKVRIVADVDGSITIERLCKLTAEIAILPGVVRVDVIEERPALAKAAPRASSKARKAVGR